VQGHSGTVGECSACHASVPFTSSGGPHGMHTVGQTWVSRHEDIAERSSAACQACHGDNYRGSVLSKTMADRSYRTEWGTKSFPKGTAIGCYDCHDGPDGD
jgi:formate-dependent nitrite reductase cytochrome c552 subunit